MPDYGPKPSNAEDDWVPIPLGEASVANLIFLALKEAQGRSLSTMELDAAVSKHRKKIDSREGIK